jgi:hypothetical protein
MAEELFLFLKDLSDSGIDLSKVDVWFDENQTYQLGCLALIDSFSYNSESNEITLMES